MMRMSMRLLATVGALILGVMLLNCVRNVPSKPIAEDLASLDAVGDRAEVIFNDQCRAKTPPAVAVRMEPLPSPDAGATDMPLPDLPAICTILFQCAKDIETATASCEGGVNSNLTLCQIKREQAYDTCRRSGVPVNRVLDGGVR